MAGNCRSLCRYAGRLDQRLLYRSKVMDELNRKRAWVLSATALVLNFVIEFRYY